MKRIVDNGTGKMAQVHTHQIGRNSARTANIATTTKQLRCLTKHNLEK
ncbi:hypothetical protein [Peptoniphilus grossensis]|uniref:Uncharacterized protein n=1 Tax=Peptoniphilus grossensis TaxID=1465756 RepID=A0ABU7X8R3_9FIRM